MKPTDLLMQEHESIKKSLKILNEMCVRLESGEKLDSAHLEQIVDFIRNYADKFHHGKEEDILFEEMCKIGFLKETGPISVMLAEHDLGRDLVKGLSDAITSCKNDDSNASSAIVRNARKFSSLLDQHIDKENNILYPMADTRLSPEQQNNMLEEFEKFEKQKISSGQRDEYYKILTNLSKVYLS
jgi:hemerythrin-like domain-containing protein